MRVSDTHVSVLSRGGGQGVLERLRSDGSMGSECGSSYRSSLHPMHPPRRRWTRQRAVIPCVSRPQIFFVSTTERQGNTSPARVFTIYFTAYTLSLSSSSQSSLSLGNFYFSPSSVVFIRLGEMRRAPLSLSCKNYVERDARNLRRIIGTDVGGVKCKLCRKNSVFELYRDTRENTYTRIEIYGRNLENWYSQEISFNFEKSGNLSWNEFW